MTRRPPHRDHSQPFRRTPAPGVPVMSEADALAVTIDEGEHTPVDHLIDRADAVLDALEQVAADRHAIGKDAHRAEQEHLPNSAWKAAVDADLAAIKAVIAKPGRWALVKAAAGWLSAGAIFAALLYAANALIAHGDGAALGRVQADAVKRHEHEIRAIQRALYFLAGRLGVDLDRVSPDLAPPKDPP